MGGSRSRARLTPCRRESELRTNRPEFGVIIHDAAPRTLAACRIAERATLPDPPRHARQTYVARSVLCARRTRRFLEVPRARRVTLSPGRAA